VARNAPDEGRDAEHRGVSAKLEFFFKRHEDHVQHIVAYREYVGVLDSQYLITKRLKILVAPLIVCDLFRLRVGCAINFDYELSFPAKEIGDERSDGFLPDKLVSIQPATAETIPQALFGFCLLASQASCAAERFSRRVSHGR
jgi:hypothetical protein